MHSSNDMAVLAIFPNFAKNILKMAKEIERKFLVCNDSYRDMATIRIPILQGYISRRPEGTVRVRIFGDKAYITVKGKNRGCIRSEWEYEIPIADAQAMLAEVTEGSILEKERLVVPYQGHQWEIDVFHGRFEGLVTAEIELPDEYETFETPSFIGEEVTGDPRYFNSNLS